VSKHGVPGGIKLTAQGWDMLHSFYLSAKTGNRYRQRRWWQNRPQQSGNKYCKGHL